MYGRIPCIWTSTIQAILATDMSYELWNRFSSVLSALGWRGMLLLYLHKRAGKRLQWQPGQHVGVFSSIISSTHCVSLAVTLAMLVKHPFNCHAEVVSWHFCSQWPFWGNIAFSSDHFGSILCIEIYNLCRDGLVWNAISNFRILCRSHTSSGLAFKVNLP